MVFRNLQSLNHAVYLLLVLYCSSIRSCSAQRNNNSSCVPSSCGNIESIRYPFRLRTDPRHCGKPGFELECRNNQAIVAFKSKSFHVESINYGNYTIRMTDPGVVRESGFCSYPNYSLVFDDIPNEFWTFKPGKFINDFINLNSYVVFVDCLNGVNSPKYILLNDTSCSRNSSGVFIYLTTGEYMMSVSDLPDSCSVDKVAWVSLTGPSMASGNASLAGIRRSLAYGFELSWQNVLCDVCEPGVSTCILTDDQVSCEKYCYEDTPYEEKSFRCKLEYLAPWIIVYGGGGIAAVLVVRFFLGLCCIGVLVRRERRRCRLWETRHKDDEAYGFEMMHKISPNEIGSSEVNAKDISR